MHNVTTMYKEFIKNSEKSWEHFYKWYHDISERYLLKAIDHFAISGDSTTFPPICTFLDGNNREGILDLKIIGAVSSREESCYLNSMMTKILGLHNAKFLASCFFANTATGNVYFYVMVETPFWNEVNIFDIQNNKLLESYRGVTDDYVGFYMHLLKGSFSLN